VWFHYDDSLVQVTSLAQVMATCQQDGYIYFYVTTAAAADLGAKLNS
jgi:hypothetical protein